MSYIRTNLKLPLQKLSREDLQKDWLIRQFPLVNDVNHRLSSQLYRMTYRPKPLLVSIEFDIPTGYDHKFHKCVRLLNIFYPSIYAETYEGFVILRSETEEDLYEYVDILKKLLYTPEPQIVVTVYGPEGQFEIEDALNHYAKIRAYSQLVK